MRYTYLNGKSEESYWIKFHIPRKSDIIVLEQGQDDVAVSIQGCCLIARTYHEIDWISHEHRWVGIQLLKLRWIAEAWSSIPFQMLFHAARALTRVGKFRTK